MTIKEIDKLIYEFRMHLGFKHGVGYDTWEWMDLGTQTFISFCWDKIDTAQLKIILQFMKKHRKYNPQLITYSADARDRTQIALQLTIEGNVE